MDRRPVDAVRAGGAISQGLDSPPLDRPSCARPSPRRAASGSGWPRFRTRIARPSASAPTSTSRCPRTTIASPRPGLPWTDCCTHFVSTHAYTHHASVLERPAAARHAVARAFPSRLPRARGQSGQPGTRPPDPLRARDSSRWASPAPHGRWRPSLDDQLEDLGYLYSSDFQIGYDDFPFYPWKGDRFSRILQIPVHPVCEGLFLEAGVDDPAVIGDYFRAGRRRRKLDAGELAVVYGHPERRLGRMPEVLTALARAIDSQPLVWRATFSELARWWRWRAERRWLVIPREDHRLEIQFDEWDTEYDFALEIHRGRFHCSLPVTGPRMSLGLAGLAYERRDESPTGAWIPRSIDRGTLSLKQAVRTALDWETVTPLDEIPRSSISNRVKRGLRWWKHKRAGTSS